MVTVAKQWISYGTLKTNRIISPCGFLLRLRTNRILTGIPFFVLRVKKLKKVFVMKHENEEKLKDLAGRNTAGFCDIGFAEQFCDMKFLKSRRKFILAMLI